MHLKYVVFTLTLLETIFLSYMLKFLNDVKHCTRDDFHSSAYMATVVMLILNTMSMITLITSDVSDGAYLSMYNKYSVIAVIFAFFDIIYNSLMINFMLRIRAQCDLSKINSLYDYLAIGVSISDTILAIALLSIVAVNS